jgi:hypothetical protein
MGIMLVKGGEKVMLKAEDSNRTRTWGSFLYLAMTVANGGNPEMFDLEAQRIKAKDPNAAAPDMSAMLEQAALQERLAAEAAARDAQVAAQAAQAAQAEADQLAKDAADAAEGDHKAAAEAAAAVAAVKAAAAAQLGKDEANYAAKAESFSRRASLTVSMMAMQVRTQILHGHPARTDTKQCTGCAVGWKETAHSSACVCVCACFYSSYFGRVRTLMVFWIVVVARIGPGRSRGGGSRGDDGRRQRARRRRRRDCTSSDCHR